MYKETLHKNTFKETKKAIAELTQSNCTDDVEQNTRVTLPKSLFQNIQGKARLKQWQELWHMESESKDLVEELLAFLGKIPK